METKIIKEIDSFSSKYHTNVGLLFFIILLLVFIIFKNLDEKGIKFIANFNYVEGIKINSQVQLAGVKVGHVNKVSLTSEGVAIEGYINENINIPEDSIVSIKSDGIFGKKALSIEPGFGNHLDKINKNYVFNQTQDSYSVDMFLRYLKEMNEQ